MTDFYSIYSFYYELILSWFKDNCDNSSITPLYKLSASYIN